MNLRQKCKKQKQYIERLERMALPVKKVVYTPESLEHLRLKRSIIIDWGMPNDSDEYFKDLTINQIAHDMGITLGDYVVFNDEEGIATLDVWIRRRSDSEEVKE